MAFWDNIHRYTHSSCVAGVDSCLERYRKELHNCVSLHIQPKMIMDSTKHLHLPYLTVDDSLAQWVCADAHTMFWCSELLVKTSKCVAMCSSRGKEAVVVSFLSTSALVQHTKDASRSSVKPVQQYRFFLLYTCGIWHNLCMSNWCLHARWFGVVCLKIFDTSLLIVLVLQFLASVQLKTRMYILPIAIAYLFNMRFVSEFTDWNKLIPVIN